MISLPNKPGELCDLFYSGYGRMKKMLKEIEKEIGNELKID